MDIAWSIKNPMKYFTRILFVLVSLYWCKVAVGQEKAYSSANAHAHNDYLNTKPFYHAYNSGFGSIEADVFPVDEKLLVAHTKKEIRPANNLADLYIKPLSHELRSGKTRDIYLLIDIKENYKSSLSLLLKELEPLKPYLNEPGKPNSVTIVVSGDRPLPVDYKNYPAYIFFDSDLKQKHSPQEWERIALVSLPFNKISGWKGESEPADNELQPVKNIVDSVHRAGKPIRFWAAPDTKLSWQWQKKMQVDLIGTDKINELRIFLNKEGN